jgi:thiol-disulfide isomerase/thioredoxin
VWLLAYRERIGLVAMGLWLALDRPAYSGAKYFAQQGTYTCRLKVREFMNSLILFAVLVSANAETGKQVLDRIIDARIAVSSAGRERGIRVSTEELDEAGKKVADEALARIDLDKIPPDETSDWAKVLEFSRRYQDGIRIIDRRLAQEPDDYESAFVKLRLLFLDGKFQEGMEWAPKIRADQPDQQLRILAAETYYLPSWLLKTKGEDPLLAYLSRVETRLAATEGGGANWVSVVKGNIGNARKPIEMANKPAPELAVLKMIGQGGNLEAFRGKVVYLDFFAHWCGPCINAFPVMARQQAELGEKGLVTLGVAKYEGFYGKEAKVTPDQEFSRMQEFVTKHKLSWPVVFVEPSTFKAYGVSAIPTAAVIDRKGNLRLLSTGASDEELKKIREMIEKLLAEP